MPTFAPEISLGHGADGLVCGIDEVGRGPLAGPVMAAAVILPPPAADGAAPAWLAGLNDSKKLSQAARERLYEPILAHARVGIGSASVEEIDAINILQATFLAMRRALEALLATQGQGEHRGRAPTAALVDGNRAPDLAAVVPGMRTATLVKGDSLSLSIAAASVVAKVTRDRIMTDLAHQNPGYGWEANAGYGTAAHLRAIKMLGVTAHHRRTFAPIAEQLALNL